MKKAIIFIVLLCSLLLAGCSQNASNTLQGYLEAELIYMASPMNGVLKQLKVHRGQAVSAGETLFDLAQQPQLAELIQAKANLHAAQATLRNLQLGQRATILQALKAQIKGAQANVKLLKAQLNRSKKLFKHKVTDKNRLEMAQEKYAAGVQLLRQYRANLAENKLGARGELIKAQQANLNNARAKVRAATWALQQKVISSPENGEIYDTYFRQGEFVPATAPVLSIYTPNTLKLIFFVPEPQLANIKIGNTVGISCDSCSSNYTAKITYISPQAEYTPPLIYSRKNNSKLVFRIKAQVAKNAVHHLHPGQPVYVSLGTAAANYATKKKGFFQSLSNLWHKVT